MNLKRTLPPFVLLLAALAAGLSLAPRESPSAPDAARAAAAQPQPAGDKDRAADRAAIKKASEAFTAALAKGDAKAMGALWTEQGEYVGEDGAVLRGRAAIEAAYQKLLAKSPGFRVEVTIEAIRFLSKDTAVEEGYAKAYKGKNEFQSSARYTILHVREDGRWLMAAVREWSDAGQTLRDLDWLIGTWVGKSESGEVLTTYEWDADKKFIKGKFTLKGADKVADGGTQVIARDPRTGLPRSWLFDNEGGFGEAAWSWDGKRWALDAAGVHADGTEVTATNLLIPIDRDSFTWQSVDRTVDGEAVPNAPPVKVTRVK